MLYHMNIHIKYIVKKYFKFINIIRDGLEKQF